MFIHHTDPEFSARYPNGGYYQCYWQADYEYDGPVYTYDEPDLDSLFPIPPLQSSPRWSEWLEFRFDGFLPHPLPSAKAAVKNNFHKENVLRAIKKDPFGFGSSNTQTIASIAAKNSFSRSDYLSR